MTIKSDVFIESKSLRESVINRIEVLDRVKNLFLLPDDLHVTVDMAANYYEVEASIIQKTISRNRVELELDGMKVLSGKRLADFKSASGIVSRAPSITLIPKRAILRMGMLLRDSEVAKAVRTNLLDLEEESKPKNLVQIPTELNLLGQISDAIQQSFKAMVNIQTELTETKKEVHEAKEENKQLKQEIDDVKNGMVDVNAPLRSQFNDAVRSYAKQRGIDWNAAYNNVYDTLGKQYHVNFRKRWENRVEKGEKVKLVDIVEELNLLVPAIRLAKTMAGVAS
jgi:regulator of replication initiation timing